MAWEHVQAGLGVPVFSRHVEAALLLVVAFEELAHHVEPAGAPLHLVDAKLGLQRRHLLLEVAEMTAVEFNKLVQLVRLQL